MQKKQTPALNRCRAASLAAAFGVISLLANSVEGADYLVANATDILLSISKLQPGDTVTMRNGIWVDASILFTGNGSSGNPITLRAETPGQVILSGESSLRLAGNYLVVDGLKFTSGYLIAGDV